MDSGNWLLTSPWILLPISQGGSSEGSQDWIYFPAFLAAENNHVIGSHSGQWDEGQDCGQVFLLPQPARRLMWGRHGES